jgi:hypothetical protein
MKFIFLFTAFFVAMFSGLIEWLTDTITVHHLANLALIVLSAFIASSATKLRLVLEKVEGILALYSKFTHPDSEKGEKLSQREKERLLEYFLSELRDLLQEFGGSIFAKVGKGVLKAVKVIGIR